MTSFASLLHIMGSLYHDRETCQTLRKSRGSSKRATHLPSPAVTYRPRHISTIPAASGPSYPLHPSRLSVPLRSQTLRNRLPATPLHMEKMLLSVLTVCICHCSHWWWFQCRRSWRRRCNSSGNPDQSRPLTWWKIHHLKSWPPQRPHLTPMRAEGGKISL